MIHWKRQGEAVVGSLGIIGGGGAQVVIVAGRSNPKGVSVILPSKDGGEPRTQPLARVLEYVSPPHLIELLCMQERLHGSGVLPAAELQ